jgi:hypothetical protein
MPQSVLDELLEEFKGKDFTLSLENSKAVI